MSYGLGNGQPWNLAYGLKKIGHEVEILVPEEGEFSELAKKEGIPAHIINIASSFRTASILKKRYLDLIALPAFRKLCRNKAFDVIQLNMFRGRILGRLANICPKNSIIVSTIHGLDPLPGPRRGYFLEKMTNWVDNATVAISEDVRRNLIFCKIPVKKIRVIYNGVNLEEIDKKNVDKGYLHRELGLDDATQLVGMIAHFYPDVKGHDIFLEAARLLIESIGKHKKVHFALVGTDFFRGNYSQLMKDYAVKLGISDSVSFLGMRNDIFSIIDSFSVLALPSKVREGFGLVLTEAMARKIPVVGSRIGGIPEVIKDKETGLLVEPNNPNSLSNAIIKILANPDIAKRMGEAGRCRVEEKFSSKVVARNYEALFCELLT